jgi:hypothetical protein
VRAENNSLKSTNALANFIVDYSRTAFEEIQIQNYIVGAPHIAVHKSNTTGTLPGSFLISFYLGKIHLIPLANNIVYIDPATGNRIEPAYHHENKIEDFFNNVRTTRLESTIKQQGKLHLYSIIFVNWYTAVDNGTNIVRFSVKSVTPAQIKDVSTLTKAERIHATHHESSRTPMTSTNRKEELRTRSNIHRTPHFKLRTAPDFFDLPSSINTHPIGSIYRYTSFVPLAHPSVFQE